MSKEDSKSSSSRGVVFPTDQTPPPPPSHQPYYYGTFQGVANHHQPYNNNPPPPSHPQTHTHHQQYQYQYQQYQNPSVGFPQPAPPPHYIHGYQTVPGIVIAPGAPVLVDRRPLPCCGCGMGWFLFLAGFFFGAIPWYFGAFILLFVRVDYREKAGYVACTIAACLALVAVGLGVQRVKYGW